MIKNIFKRGTVITLSAMMVLSSAVPVYAGDEPVEVIADNSDADKEIGNVTNDDYDIAVIVSAENGNTAEVTTGDITSNTDDSIALNISAISRGKTNVIVDGDIDSKGTGVNLAVDENSDNYIYVTGDVTTSGDEGVAITMKTSGGNNSAKIDGDLQGGDGALLSAYAGKNELKVSDNITGKTSGLNVSSENKGANDIIVGGDVTANGDQGIGLVLNNDGRNGKNSVVVEGTVSGKSCSIATLPESKAENNSIAVWKIEKNKYGNVAEKYGDDTHTADKDTEKSINYIIKIEQSEGATLSATDANGKALSSVIGYSDTWNTAKEGDRVLLKIDVQEGYELLGAYGDEGQSLSLIKDSQGNYYIDVPKGGGVYFSVVLEKAAKQKPKTEPKNETKNDETDIAPQKTPENNDDPVPTAGPALQVSAPAIANSSDSTIISLISTAAPGSTVTLDCSSSTELSAAVVQALLARKDVTYIIHFMFNGVLYEVTIPAGSDFSKCINASGGIYFEALFKVFEAKKV